MQCISRLFEIPSHRGAVEVEVLGDLCHRLPRLVEHHPLYQLRERLRWIRRSGTAGGLAVDRDAAVEHYASGECLRLLALGLLDVLAYCAQSHIVFLGDLRVGHPVVEVVGHQLLYASPPEPDQEAALLEVCSLLGWPASSHRRLQRASGRHQRVAVFGVGLQDLRHIPLTRTLGSCRAAEGLFVFGCGRPASAGTARRRRDAVGRVGRMPRGRPPD